MKFGTLDFTPANESLDLVADPTKRMIEDETLQNVYVSEIDADLSDTAAFCEHYQIGMDQSANCVVVEAKRADKVWYAACVILATTKADINSTVRRYLDARKISFAPMDKATAMTSMEFGGITPIGLPADMPLIIDSAVAGTDRVIIGSGIRRSKLLVPGQLLSTLPNAVVMDIVKAS